MFTLKYSASGVMGHLKGKGSLTIFDGHASMKHKFGNRKFRAEGCCVSAVGLSEATVARCIRERERAGIAPDRLGVKEYEDPFDGGRGGNSAGLTGPLRVDLQCGPNPVRAGAFRRVTAIQGLCPKGRPPILGVVLISKITHLAGDSLNRTLKFPDVRMPFITLIRPLSGSCNITNVIDV